MTMLIKLKLKVMYISADATNNAGNKKLRPAIIRIMGMIEIMIIIL